MRAIFRTLSLSGILLIILMLICLFSSFAQVFGAQRAESKPKKLPKFACREYPREDGPSSFEQLSIKGYEKDERGAEYLLVKYPSQSKSDPPKRLAKDTKGLQMGPCRLPAQSRVVISAETGFSGPAAPKRRGRQID